MYVIGICDDELSVCSRIESWIHESHKKVDTEVFINGEDLLKYLKSGMHIDLLYLDIELGSVNGVEIGRYIREEMSNEDMHIVYISAKQEYAMELFDNRPLNFLIKPLEKKKLLGCIDKAMEISKMYNDYYEVKTGGNINRIPYKNIIYFYSRNKKIVVRLIDESFEFYGKLSDIMDHIPDSFIRIHKSYLVNHSHIKKYEYDTVMMTNDEILSISQPNRKAIRRHIIDEMRIN